MGGHELRRSPTSLLAVALAVVVAGCGPQALGASSQGSAPGVQSSSGPKRLIAAIKGDPPSLNTTVISSGGSGSVPGADAVEQLVMVGLASVDNRDSLIPRLAEAVPSIENGLWRVLPDGRMDMTWKIHPKARWHDGMPFTSADLAFSLMVAADNDVAIFRNAKHSFIEGFEAPDPQTFTVRWKTPFIVADKLFVNALNLEAPLPKHLLERPFIEDRGNFRVLPYWSEEFVGTGPFRLRTFARGSHVLLEANDSYVLGRPRLDEIEVRFIADGNTLVANLLSGTVEVALGRSLSLDQAIHIRDHWADGKMEVGPVNWMALYPQFLNPNPPVMLDARLRRALYHAIDRLEMVDAIQGGLGGVAHSIIIPSEPEYRDLERQVIRYDFDPARSAQIIEELGYVRGADGGFRDAAGQRLAVDIRASDEDINSKVMFPVADYWQRVGVGVTTTVMTAQQRRDRPWRATYPGFEVVSQGHAVGNLPNLRSTEVPTPETDFVGENRSRYASPEFDALLDRYLTAIPKRERAEALAPIIRHMTDQLVWMGLFNRVDGVVFAKRVHSIFPRQQGGNQGWNAHEWDVT